MNKNKKTTFIASLMMFALVATSVSYGSAFAQESLETDEVVDKQRHYRPHSILAGAGAAVNEENHGLRSHFKLGLVQVDAEDGGYEVKKGKFVAGKRDNRHAFQVIPEDWFFEVNSETTFVAGGFVDGEDGETYMVELKGEKIHDLQKGNLYYVKGIAHEENTDDVENDDSIELFYISAMFDREPKIRPLPLESNE